MSQVVVGPVCPKDLKGCCDDLCYGSGCVQMMGEPMIYWCKNCGEDSDSFWFSCDCTRDEENYYDEETEG